MVLNLHFVKTNIKKFEIIILLVFSTLIPSFILTFFLNKNENVNYFSIISIYYSLFLLITLMFNVIFKRSYLAALYGCHCKKERSFKIVNKHVCLCARCTGIFIGMISFLLLTFFKFNLNWLLVISLPLIIDGIYQKKSKVESNNIRRITTGILFGIAFVVLLSNMFYLYSRFVLWVTKIMFNL